MMTKRQNGTYMYSSEVAYDD